MLTPNDFNKRGQGYFPGHLGISVTEVGAGHLRAELEIKPFLIAPNGYLHAGSVVTLADTASGYGCIANLPDGASGFTTIELKCNYIGTAREGFIDCLATAAAPGWHDSGMGRGGDAPGHRKSDRPVSMHSNDPVSEGALMQKLTILGATGGTGQQRCAGKPSSGDIR